MFSGIISTTCPIVFLEKKKSLLTYSLLFSSDLCHSLKTGESVSVNGVCQTITKIKKQEIFFQAIPATLACTTLGTLKKNEKVHVERALQWGQEVGGHLLSGHISTTGKFFLMNTPSKDSCEAMIHIPSPWNQYLFEKGYIGIDGVSLTLQRVDVKKRKGWVALIPETLKRTLFLTKKQGEEVNIEIDLETIRLVETTSRFLSHFFSKKNHTESEKKQSALSPPLHKKRRKEKTDGAQ